MWAVYSPYNSNIAVYSPHKSSITAYLDFFILNLKMVIVKGRNM